MRRSNLDEEETVNHIRWIILVAIGALSLAGAGCQREGTNDQHDRGTSTTTTEAPRPGAPRADQRTGMPEQRADMPRQDQRTEMPRTPATAAATAAISAARCEREQRCGNIGASHNYASNEACMTQVRREWAQDLSARECPQGVEQQQLTSCLNEIRQEECGNPFDSLERVAACRTSAICRG
jgi:hypothetical protein